MFLSDVDKEKRKLSLLECKELLRLELDKANPYADFRIEVSNSGFLRNNGRVIRKRKVGEKEWSFYTDSSLYGPSIKWLHQHNRKIRSLQATIKELESDKLVGSQKRLLELRKLYYELFLNLYKLKQDEFIVYSCSNLESSFQGSDDMTLVKKSPGIQVRTYISKILIRK